VPAPELEAPAHRRPSARPSSSSCGPSPALTASGPCAPRSRHCCARTAYARSGSPQKRLPPTPAWQSAKLRQGRAGPPETHGFRASAATAGGAEPIANAAQLGFLGLARSARTRTRASPRAKLGFFAFPYAPARESSATCPEMGDVPMPRLGTFEWPIARAREGDPRCPNQAR
jgi:hypothetical protein